MDDILNSLAPKTVAGFNMKRKMVERKLEKAHFEGDEEKVLEYEKVLKNVDMEIQRLRSNRSKNKDNASLDWIND